MGSAPKMGVKGGATPFLMIEVLCLGASVGEGGAVGGGE